MLRSTHTAQSRKALQSKSGSKIAKVGVVGKKIDELRSGFIAREGKPSSEVTWDITASDESNHMLVQTCKHARAVPHFTRNNASIHRSCDRVSETLMSITGCGCMRFSAASSMYLRDLSVVSLVR
jgi:hypothetical protein